MITKLRGKFLPQDYRLSLFRQMQNIRQRLMSVGEYTEEFYKVNIKAGYVQDTAKKSIQIYEWFENGYPRRN